MKPPRIMKAGLPPARSRGPRPGMSKDHLTFVRGLPCCICGATAGEAHHLLRVEGRGMGMKAADRWAIPLCHKDHMALHAAGDEEGFLAQRGVDGRSLAERLWRITGDHQQGVRAVMRACTPGRL